MRLLERMARGLCISCERPLVANELTNWCSPTCMEAMPYPIETDQLPVIYPKQSNGD